MKIQGGKKIHYDSGPNMTPLVDIVMVILIFLMLAGSFGGVTNFLTSKQGLKSKGGMGAKLPPGTVPDVPYEIRVDNLNPAYPNAGFITRGPGVDGITDPDRLKTQLAGKL